MQILFERSFSRELKKIKDKRVLKRVNDVIAEAESAASLNEVANLKKLEGFNTYYQIRVGDTESALRFWRAKLFLFASEFVKRFTVISPKPQTPMDV